MFPKKANSVGLVEMTLAGRTSPHKSAREIPLKMKSQKSSLQYILENKISFPEDIFLYTNGNAETETAAKKNATFFTMEPSPTKKYIETTIIIPLTNA